MRSDTMEALLSQLSLCLWIVSRWTPTFYIPEECCAGAGMIMRKYASNYVDVD